MTPQVKNLANLMRVKRREGEKKFVLMLGAGASIGSGVKPTSVIMEELLDQHGQGIQGASLEARFDQLWKRMSDEDRGAVLRPYLKMQPSPGYGLLAQLIEEKYVDVILTFNYDNLVEQALRAIHFADFKVIVRGETRDEEMQKLVDAREPRVKLVKLHGSVQSSDHFLFTTHEMSQYPSPIHALVGNITANALIVCGYAFNDTCVVRAFAGAGETIVCVDPAGVPRPLRGFLPDRRSEGLAVEAKFDPFLEELHRELHQPQAPAEVEEKLPPNPFKFLQSYEERDADALPGRDAEIADFRKKLGKLPQVIVVAGPEKAGKTSLARAGLLPGLVAARYRGIYLRCQANLDQALLRDLQPQLGGGAEPTDLPAALRRLADSSPDRRVVLFLDQFERVAENLKSLRTRDGQKQLATYLANGLLKGLGGNLTVVLIVTDEDALGGKLCQVCRDADLTVELQEVLAFEKGELAEIIGALAATGGREFEKKGIGGGGEPPTGHDDLLQEIATLYEESKAAPARKQRFTLAHVQAVCHLLAVGTRLMKYDDYQRFAAPENLGLLNEAINVWDLMSFVEDFSWPHGVWLRNLIKVPLRENKGQIAQFIREHALELVPQPDPAAGRP